MKEKNVLFVQSWGNSDCVRVCPFLWCNLPDGLLPPQHQAISIQFIRWLSHRLSSRLRKSFKPDRLPVSRIYLCYLLSTTVMSNRGTKQKKKICIQLSRARQGKKWSCLFFVYLLGCVVLEENLRQLLSLWHFWKGNNYRYQNHSCNNLGKFGSVDHGTSYNPPVKRKVKSSQNQDLQRERFLE